MRREGTRDVYPAPRADGFYWIEGGGVSFAPFRLPPDIEETPPAPPKLKIDGRLVRWFRRDDPLQQLADLKGHGL